jgi:hypothetical protein
LRRAASSCTPGLTRSGPATINRAKVPRTEVKAVISTAIHPCHFRQNINPGTFALYLETLTPPNG